MPAAAIPSICRRRSHLVPPQKHVPASFSFRFSHRGLDAFQEFRTDTLGKVSLGRRQRPPSKRLLLLQDIRWGLPGWAPTVGRILMRWSSSSEEAQSKPPTAAEGCVMAQARHGNRHSNVAAISQPPSLPRGLRFCAPTTGDGKT